MFHYQVGSLEEEPPIIAARMIERGFRSAAVVFDQSPVGRRYAEYFEAARARLGLEVTGTASITSLTEDADRHRDATACRQSRCARVLRSGRLFAGRCGRAHGSRLGHSGARELGAHVRLRTPRLARRLCGLGVHRHHQRRQPTAGGARRRSHRTRRADRSAARPTTWAVCSARASRKRITSPAPGSPTDCAGPSSSRQPAVTKARSWGSAPWSTRR